MNHLKWRSHPSLCQPMVAYLCGDVEDTICNSIEKLQDWPSTMHWNLDTESPVLMSAQRCQSWLFFGLLNILTSISGRNFDSRGYVSQESGRQIIDTAQLLDLLDRVSTKLFISQWTPRLLRARRMTTYGYRLYHELSLAVPIFCNWSKLVVEEHERSIEACDLWSSEAYGVFLSTIILIEQILDLASVHGLIQDDLRAHLASFIISTHGLGESFRKIGQCTSAITKNRLHPASAYRLLSLPANNGLEHSTCTIEYCASFDVDYSTYVPYHNKGCHGQYCPMRHVLEDVLCKIITRSAVPLVQSQLGPEDEVIINIVDGTEVKDFITISHVWAGGLGNFTANAHYQCQLRRIHHNLAKQASRNPSRTVLFYWFDTLCVPVSNDELRAQAISSMAQVYARAECVLVIDPYLSSVNTETLTTKEIDLAMVSAPWMGRSWTFQEGALASQLTFEFADRLVSFEELDYPGSLAQQTSIQRLWSFGVDVKHSTRYLTSSSKTFERTIERRSRHVDPESKLSIVWNELSKRSTSKPEDVAAILAVFLDCNPTEILNLPSSQRIQAVIGSQAMLSIDILLAKVYALPTWSPIPPSCRPRSTPLRVDLGNMAHKQWGVFNASQLNFVRLLKLRESTVSVVQDHMYDWDRKTCYSIAFDNIGPEQRSRPSHSPLMLIRDHDSTARIHGRGILLDLIKENESGVYLRYKRSFDYTYLDCADGHHEASCSTSASTVFEPFDVDLTIEHPLHLDMRIECSKLEWSSSKFYPVLIANIERTRLLSIFSQIATLSWFAAYVYFSAQLGTLSKCYGFLPALLAIYAAYIPFTLGRSYLLHVELRYLYRQASSKFQLTVNASFCPQHRTSSVLCNRSHNRMPTILASIYAGLFLISTTVTFGALRQSFATAQWPIWSPVYQRFLYTVMLVFGDVVEGCRFSRLPATFGILVCKMIFLELSARLALLALTSKNLLWDVQAVPSTPDKTFATSLVRWQSDPKYMLMMASSRFFFTPFLVVYTVCLWIQKLKEDVRWPTYEDIYNWFALYGWTYDVYKRVMAVYDIQHRRLMVRIRRCWKLSKRVLHNFAVKARRLTSWKSGRSGEETPMIAPS